MSCSPMPKGFRKQAPLRWFPNACRLSSRAHYRPSGHSNERHRHGGRLQRADPRQLRYAGSLAGFRATVRKAIRQSCGSHSCRWRSLRRRSPDGPFSVGRTPDWREHHRRMTELTHSNADLRDRLASRRSGTVGLVPTMGALHAGHARLIEATRSQWETVVRQYFRQFFAIRPQGRSSTVSPVICRTT